MILPLDRRVMVRARYLFVILMLLVAAAFALAGDLAGALRRRIKGGSTRE